VDGHQHPGNQAGPLDQVDVGQLGAHEPADRERQAPEESRRHREAAPAQEHVEAERSDRVDEDLVDDPRRLGGQDAEQQRARVEGAGVETAEEGGSAPDVGVPQGEMPVVEVPGHEHPEREVLNEVVSADEGVSGQG
jgi:hypothetical protein